MVGPKINRSASGQDWRVDFFKVVCHDESNSSVMDLDDFLLMALTTLSNDDDDEEEEDGEEDEEDEEEGEGGGGVGDG